MDTRVVYLEEGRVWVDRATLPTLGPSQILVKAHQASVCGSERYFYRGINVRPRDEARGGPDEQSRRPGERRHAYPMGPLGHEGGGTVVEVGSAVDEYLGGGKVAVGDRVGSLTYPTYTDYWVTDPAHAQPIPDGVPFEVGCLYEPLGCAGWAALHLGIKPGDIVAVNGAGFAGNIILQGALKAGAYMVIAVDPVAAKLEIARQLGAHVTIDPSDGGAVERALDLTDGEGVDVAVDAVGGTGRGIVQALDMVRHAGILALYGDNYAPVNDFCFHRFHEDGLEIRTLNPVHYTRLQSIENMREAFRAVRRGVFNLDVILEHSERHRLDDIGEVFRKEAAAGDSQASLKTLILP